MSKQIQFRGGTTAQHSVFTGAVREITVDTDKDTLVVHDGATVGGFPVARESALNTHTSRTDNPHGTSFANLQGKPTTIAGYGITDADTSAQVTTKINNAVAALVDSSPATLDTLNELAAALGDDPNFATTITNSIATKVTKNVDIVAGTGTKVTYDVKGLVTSSTTPTTLAGYGITDADTSAQVTTKINNAVAALVDSSPATLDTLNELAAALGDDPNFATTITNSIATKVTKNVDIVAGTGTKVTYDVKGLVTSSTTPTTLAGYSISDAYTKTELNNGQLDSRYYTESEVNAALALKVDDTEIASVNLLRADRYLAAQNVASMVCTNSDLTKIQYNNATNVDYEVLNYTSGNLTSINHYVGSVLKGTTTLSYTSGNLVSAIFVGV